jgi:hypothetical protein
MTVRKIVVIVEPALELEAATVYQIQQLWYSIRAILRVKKEINNTGIELNVRHTPE